MKKLLASLMSIGVLMSGSLAWADALLINGAGATFPYPIYSKWFDEYHKIHPDVQFNYQSIGSGGGIRQITEKTVDFRASDVPMSAAQLQAAPGALLHFPTVMIGLVPTSNLEGGIGTINFTQIALAANF